MASDETLNLRITSAETEIGRLAARMRDLELSRASEEAHKHNVEFRLKGIEESVRWVVRLIIGAMILGLIAFFLDGGLSLVGQR